MKANTKAASSMDYFLTMIGIPEERQKQHRQFLKKTFNKQGKRCLIFTGRVINKRQL